MNRPRMGCLAVSALVSIAIGVLFAVRAGRRTFYSNVHPPISFPSFVAEESFERERGVATALGMVLAEDIEETLPPVRTGLSSWSGRLTVGPRECVAVIASTSGYQIPRRLGLFDGEPGAGATEPLVSHVPSGLVAHVQWCAVDARTLSIALMTQAPGEYPAGARGTGMLRLAVYRGTWERVGGPLRLTRGTIDRRSMASVPASVALEALRRLAPRNGTAIGPGYDIGFVSGARLIPFGLGTYAPLYRITANDAGVPVNPAVDRSEPDGGLRFATTNTRSIAYYAMNLTAPPDAGIDELHRLLADGGAAPRSHLPVADLGHDYVRVLGVVDTSVLGAECVALTFTRLVFGERAAVSRLEWEVIRANLPLGTVENVATDVVCPTSIIPRVYVVPMGDHAVYHFHAYALPRPSGDGGSEAGSAPGSDASVQP